MISDAIGELNTGPPNSKHVVVEMIIIRMLNSRANHTRGQMCVVVLVYHRRGLL